MDDAIRKMLSEPLRPGTIILVEKARSVTPEQLLQVTAGILKRGGATLTASAIADLVNLCIELEDRVKELETEAGRMESAR